MKLWPIALSTGCFYRRSIFDVLEPIREIGFEAVEICSFPMHLDYHDQESVVKAGDRLRALDLNPVSFHAPFSDSIDITASDAGVRAIGIHELETACEAAAALGVETVVLHPGPERRGNREGEDFRTCMYHAGESLNQVAAHCEKLGVHLVLENMLPHLLFGHLHDMLYLLGCIRSTNVGTCLDTGHAFLAQELDTVIPKLSGHLHLVHVNDNRGDRDAHLVPGEGHIDWPKLMRQLEDGRFTGTLVLELSSENEESIASMLDRAWRARGYLADLMTAV